MLPTLRRATVAARRVWSRHPAFAGCVAVVVALVATANAVAFATAWSVLFKPLPYRDADQLVELRIHLTDIDFRVGLSHLMYQQVAAADDVFAAAIGTAEAWQPRLDGDGVPWSVARVTADFGRVLGMEPALGRMPSAGSTIELLLSDRSWRLRFGADPDVLGRIIAIGDTRYTVVGVAAPGFAWPDSSADAWTPYVATPGEREQEHAGAFGAFHVAARLAPNATLAQAAARLDGILRQAGGDFLRRNTVIARPDVRPWRARFTQGTVQPLLLLQAAALLLLLVAAANIANLCIERAAARRGELAVRHALGARRRDMLAATAAELLSPALAGSLLGAAMAVPMLRMVQARGLVPDALVAPDGALAAPWVAAIGSAALIVLAATLATTIAAAALRGTATRGAATGADGRLRAGMLVAQVALATVLCGGAGLLLRSAVLLQSEERGFDDTGVLLTQVDMGASSAIAAAPAGGPAPAALQRLREAIERQPGVRRVALADMPPFGGAEFKASVLTPATPAPVDVRAASVEPGYFEAMGIPVLAGAPFSGSGSSDILPVVVDAAFRDRWLPQSDAVGATIRIVDGGGAQQLAQVVGVVGTVRQRALSEPGQPTIYRPGGSGDAVSFLVTRTSADPAQLAPMVQRELQRIAPGAVLMFNRPLAEAILSTTAGARALTALAVWLGAATGVLCALGSFAVIAASVTRRRAEIGLRCALGATARRVQRMMMRQGAVLVACGIAGGVALGIALSGLFAERLYRVAPADPVAWLAAAALVGALALAACWLPARNAARIAPTMAMRDGMRRF